MSDKQSCPDCKHTLKDNRHGPDQNDFYWDKDEKLRHCGACTYCKFCNPALFAHTN